MTSLRPFKVQQHNDTQYHAEGSKEIDNNFNMVYNIICQYQDVVTAICNDHALKSKRVLVKAGKSIACSTCYTKDTKLKININFDYIYDKYSILLVTESGNKIEKLYLQDFIFIQKTYNITSVVFNTDHIKEGLINFWKKTVYIDLDMNKDYFDNFTNEELRALHYYIGTCVLAIEEEKIKLESLFRREKEETKKIKQQKKQAKKDAEIEERKKHLTELKARNEEKLKTQQDLINIAKEEEELRLRKEKEDRELQRLKEEREKQKAEKLERHRLAHEKKMQKKKK